VESSLVTAVDVTGVPYYFDTKKRVWVAFDKSGPGTKIISPGGNGVVALSRDGDFYVR